MRLRSSACGGRSPARRARRGASRAEAGTWGRDPAPRRNGRPRRPIRRENPTGPSETPPSQPSRASSRRWDGTAGLFQRCRSQGSCEKQEDSARAARPPATGRSSGVRRAGERPCPQARASPAEERAAPAAKARNFGSVPWQINSGCYRCRFGLGRLRQHSQ